MSSALTEYFVSNLEIAVQNGDEVRLNECLFCGTPRTMKVNVRTGDFICFHRHCKKRGRRAGLVMAITGGTYDDAIGQISMILRGVHRATESNDEMRERLVRQADKSEPVKRRTPRPTAGLPPDFIPCWDGEGFDGIEYLTGRGVSEESIKRWGIGYADRGPLAGRVIIPVRTEGTTSWVARAARPDLEGPRYRTPKGAPTRVLFGYDEVPSEADIVLAVEGTFDAIRTWSYGIPTVAYLKDGLSLEQVHLLERKHPKRLVIFPDAADENAQKRAIRDANAMASRFQEVAVIIVKSDEKIDPDTMPREQLEYLVHSAPAVSRLDTLRMRMRR